MTTNAGDTFQTNALVDNVLVSPNRFCNAATKFYANGHDLADPMLSPIYGDMHGFPPAILTSGTRDLLLSNTVRADPKLREAGVETRCRSSRARHTHNSTAMTASPRTISPSPRSRLGSTVPLASIPYPDPHLPPPPMPGSFSDHAANERTFSPGSAPPSR